MVDINLFKEDEEEQQQDGQPEPEGTGTPESDDVFGDDLGFDDSLDDVDSDMDSGNNSENDFGGDDLLDEEDTVPEFEDDEEFDEEDEDQEMDYDFGEAKEKKAPVWLWILLVIVVLGAGFYLFIYPKMTQKIATPIPREDQATQVPDQTIPMDSSQTVANEQLGQDQGTSTPSSMQTPKQIPSRTVSSARVSNAGMVSVSTTVLGNLTRLNQFGAILITDDQFMVQYASETPGVAEAMGSRIKALLDVKEVKISPEDRNMKGNQVRYEGVISGTLPRRTETVANPVIKQYGNADQFVSDIRGLLTQFKLSIQSVQKMSDTSEGVPVQVKAEGSQQSMMQFMERVQSIQGNLQLDKLFLSPASLLDYQAEKLKVVLDFTVLLK